MKPRTATLNRSLLALFISLLAGHTSAQSKTVQLDCVGTHIQSIPFKEDSIGSYTNKWVKDSIIEPITHSQADWEIREYTYTTPFSLLGKVSVIRCVNHKMEKFQINWRQAMLAAIPKKPVRVFNPERGQYSQGIFILSSDSISNHPDDSSKLEQLVGNHLFDIKDIGQTIDSLLSQKIQVVKLLDGDMNYNTLDTLHERPKNLAFIPYMEIKIGNRYRNFKISDKYVSINPGNAAFDYYDQLLKTFQSIFSNH
jgi:hypothetical protein